VPVQECFAEWFKISLTFEDHMVVLCREAGRLFHRLKNEVLAHINMKMYFLSLAFNLNDFKIAVLNCLSQVFTQGHPSSLRTFAFTVTQTFWLIQLNQQKMFCKDSKQNKDNYLLYFAKASSKLI